VAVTRPFGEGGAGWQDETHFYRTGCQLGASGGQIAACGTSPY